MKIHKFEVYVFDFENMGVEACAQEVERSKYASITVKQPETADIGDWDDSHELNQDGTPVDRFRSYFAALSQPAAAQGDSSHSAGGECGGAPQPLTDEQIIEIRKDCYSRTPITTPWTDCIKFARAILAATKATP